MWECTCMQVPMDVRGVRSSAAGVRGAGNLTHRAISTGLFSLWYLFLLMHSVVRCRQPPETWRGPGNTVMGHEKVLPGKHGFGAPQQALGVSETHWGHRRLGGHDLLTASVIVRASWVPLGG